MDLARKLMMTMGLLASALTGAAVLSTVHGAGASPSPATGAPPTTTTTAAVDARS